MRVYVWFSLELKEVGGVWYGGVNREVGSDKVGDKVGLYGIY